MKKLGISLFFTLLATFLTASGADQHQTFFVRSLGLAQDLSSSHVMSVAHDKRGIIWVATEDGLNIFDGGRFIPIYKGEGRLSGNELNRLLDDPADSVMWIATQRAGINAFNYNTGEVKYFRHDDKDASSLITDDVTDFAATSDGNILASTWWHGVDLYNRQTGKFEHFNNTNVKGMPDAHVWAVADGGDGDTFFAGHQSEGFTMVSRKGRTAENFLPDGISTLDVCAILPLNNREVLAGTDRGIFLFDRMRHSFGQLDLPMLAGNKVFALARGAGNEIWAATEFNGIFVLDLSNGSDNITVTRPQLASNHSEDFVNNFRKLTVRTLSPDSYGNMWAGLWSAGMAMLSPVKPLFSEIGQSNDSPENAFPAIPAAGCLVTDRQGTLFVGTDGNGVHRYDNNRMTGIFTYDASPLRANHLQAALRDDKGRIWFGAFSGGIFEFSPETGKFTPVDLGPGNEQADVRSITEIGGNVVAVSSHGIFFIDPEKKRVVQHHEVNNARAMTTDSDGGHWVGTFGHGLLRYDKDMKFLKIYNVDSGFPSNTVNDLITDSKGRVWAATGEGVVSISPSDDSDIEIINQDNGLTNDFICSVIEDLDGNIWVTTNKGISNIRQGKALSFTTADNIPPSSFLPGSKALAPDGHIFFGGTNGPCVFDPRDVLDPHAAPQAIISDLTVYTSGEHNRTLSTLGMLDTGRSYTLPYRDNTLDFTVSVGNYAVSDRVEYSFMLEGFDNDWFSNGTNSVSYRNLPPGKYTFKVRTRIRNLEWSDSCTWVKITIEPPLWLTWWMKLIYVAVIAGIGVFFLILYRRRLKAENLYLLEKKRRVQDQELTDERLRFYTNITHELRTPLTLIMGPIDDALKDGSLDDRDRQRLAVVHRNAEKLLQLVSQVLEFRKTETACRRLCIRRENIVSTVYEVALKYKELVSDFKGEIITTANPEVIEIPYDREAMMMILDNLISNALKYTVKGFIKVSCEYHPGEEASGERPCVEIKVSDTGYGISPEVLPHIFERYYQERGAHQASGTGIGLALVKNLVELHHGEIHVDSRQNVGTTFTLRFFADEKYPEAIVPEPLDSPALPAYSDSGEGDQERKRPLLLLVEDNTDLREYIAGAVTDLYDVHTAADGRTGLEIARRTMPDIILTDIMMPVMDGFELLAGLKSDILTSHIPVVVITAKDSEPDREKGYRLGADSYLTKPFSANLLISRIENILRRHVVVAPPVKPAGNEPETPPASEEPKLSELDTAFMKKLNDSITDHISSENVDVPFLADCMCMSRATLYRKIKTLTGLSPNEYIRRLRMQKAVQLLREGRYTISEIAFKVGIKSTPYFRQCFREEFNTTPSEYLKSIKDTDK